MSAALARDAAAKAVENLPLTFIFTRPDGVEDRRIVSDGKSAGGHAVDLTLADNAMRGTWTGRRSTPIPSRQPVASADVPGRGLRAGSHRVRPDRPTSRRSAPGEPANVTVDGRFLYGAPAAGLALEGEVDLSTTREWERFTGY